ncbi:MAG: hypothetical protein JO151_05775 [Verrucomicrobia bacterium]|nr:hypothetical protein [Verrucomicrobiota bacterium]
MLREDGREILQGGISNWLSKLNPNLRKGVTMEIVKGIHDLAIVLGFPGIVIVPRAVVTYIALREGE